MMMKCISKEYAFNCSRISIVAYADCIHHDVLSSERHSDMDSTSPRLRLT
jgi:hypothetical protein